MSFLKETIYQLKMEYPEEIEYHQRKVGSTDFSTGRKVKYTVDFIINKAIVLPDRIFREVAASNLFKYSSTTDINDRRVIIDANDLEVVPEIEDYITLQGKKYSIKEVMTLENVAYLCILKGVEHEQ